jgi:hypothetical protein
MHMLKRNEEFNKVENNQVKHHNMIIKNET